MNGSATLAFALPVLGLLLLTTVPTGEPYSNRLFNAIMRPPADLVGFPPDLPARYRARPEGGHRPGEIRSAILAPPGLAFALGAQGYAMAHDAPRGLWGDPAATQTSAFAHEWLGSLGAYTVVLPDWRSLRTPYSISGLLSGGGHWLPRHVALGFAGTPELEQQGAELGGSTEALPGAMLYPQNTELRTPFMAYQQVLLAPAPGKSTALLNLPISPDRDTLVVVSGEARSGPLVMGPRTDRQLIEPTTLDPGESKFLHWRIPGARSAGLAIKGEGRARFKLDSVRVLLTLPLAPAANEPATGRMIAQDLLVEAATAPAGLRITLELEPGSDHVVELRGKSLETIPTLRVDQETPAGDATRYLSANEGGLRFRVHAAGQVRLLLYQDQPFRYELDSLKVWSVRTASDKTVPEIFDVRVANEGYQLAR